MQLIIYFVLFIIIIYAVLKEREELSCDKFSISQQCDDDNNVFLKGTKITNNDDSEKLFEKLKSILSYHEKSGVWKRCLIIAVIIIFIIRIIDEENNCLKEKTIGGKYYYIFLLLLIFTLQYFYQNYLNYHHFRRLKNNGIEIINKLKTNMKNTN
jgi:hypothetical protein